MTCARGHVARALERSVVDFESRLRDAEALLDAWLMAQGVWGCLRPVFSGDVAKQLPAESRRFEELEDDEVDALLGEIERESAL